MKREYHKWFSPQLKKDMELLVFGHAGAPVLFFPTRTARFYDYENWKIIASLVDKIESGYLQIYCVDSNDLESFYSTCVHPSQRILRHLDYEAYILKEVVPLVYYQNTNRFLIAAGCSLGAYHAMNIALRHPHLFSKVVCLSGRYDLTIGTHDFCNLFEGYSDENVYMNMPTHYMPNLNDPVLLDQIRRMEIIMAVGKMDPFLPNNTLLHEILQDKQINSRLDVWEGEAHRSRYWRQMVRCYL